MAGFFSFDREKLRKRFRKVLIWSGVVLVAGSVLFYFMADVVNFNFSTGSRAGQVMKLSKKGLLFQTWEGQMDMGGISTNLANNNSAISSVWEFSVDGRQEQVIELINRAKNTGQRVNLHYKEKLYTLPWRGDTKYFITKVEFVDPATGQSLPSPNAEADAQPAY